MQARFLNQLAAPRARKLGDLRLIVPARGMLERKHIEAAPELVSTARVGPGLTAWRSRACWRWGNAVVEGGGRRWPTE